MVGDEDSQATVDTLIVVGGPAGLSAAINLARALRSVVECDATRPGRSDWAQTRLVRCAVKRPLWGRPV